MRDFDMASQGLTRQDIRRIGVFIIETTLVHVCPFPGNTTILYSHL